MTTLKLLDNISRKTDVLTRLGYGLFWVALFVATLGAGRTAQAAVTCTDTIEVDVVVLDNPTVFNRLGAQNPNWITYALKRDVVAVDPVTRLPTGDPAGTNLTAGNVELRPDKRPRPLVVRSREGACLTVNFTNLLAPVANAINPQQAVLAGVDCNENPAAPECILDNNDQVAGRYAGFHASGTELVSGTGDDGSFTGANASSLVAPGGSAIYRLYTPHEGAFIINSYGATLGSEANSGNLAVGMFGALNVQPKGAKFYRSQVTEEELRLATVGRVPSDCDVGDVHGIDCNPGGQPIIDYDAVYPGTQAASFAACDTANADDPLGAVFCKEGKAGLPILNMLDGNKLVHSDINAIIAGPCTGLAGDPAGCGAAGSFPASTYPLESVGKSNPSLPQRLQPYREFSSIFHDEQTNSQVFPKWYNNPVLGYTLAGVKDQFMINYGSGGIGSEIIANRLHTGPMHDCADCAYEEFFLASQTVGDPAMLVNFPANTGIEACDPTNILDATCWRQFEDPVHGAVGANPPIPGNEALFQEDPSNVHHAYTGDAVKIRNIHAGSFEQHIFHLHNHQWLFNPNDDNANYLDAQEIMPGSGHTYELVYGGAGNRNQTVGDAIFHCHFYPHFAQGMWYHIRNHDVLETGTVLQVSVDADPLLDPQNPSLVSGFHTEPFALRSGRPAAGARALPDGELPDGSPIPAVVPLPGKAMPQMPAKVEVMAVDRGDFGVLSGRRPPNGLGQGPDSAQAVVDFTSVAGADGVPGTDDDVSPGFPFFLAGNTCGAGADLETGACPEGTVGQRMPTPLLDMLTEAGATVNGYNPALAGGWDGGLPRHNLRGYTSGALSLDTQNRLDFRKVIKAAPPVYYPETGTDLEKVSMAYQSHRWRPSAANNLGDNMTTPADFKLNGRPPVPAGPYNDPCVDDLGNETKSGYAGSWHHGDDEWGTPRSEGGTSQYGSDNPRTYKIANVQIDAVFNKVGHHYSQERIIALWEDVLPTINKQRPPEPLVMRFNSFDCGKILHTNLVPAEFELDDFQVRTPTDIIGQHIHLPKWDLTTGDGAANGWNYEDGTLAPRMVQERIEAINNYNDLAQAQAGGADAPTLPDVLTALGVTVNPILATAVQNHVVDLDGLEPVATIDTGDPGSAVHAGSFELHPEPHPFFGTGMQVAGTEEHPVFEYAGARTTIQRIFVDPVLNVAGVDRGLGLTFSHDHYGPSTFQQIGLYSTILAEPAGSTWVHNESGEPLNTRHDGGPTTWQAVIDTPEGSPVKDHREFYFEMSDFQHAYEAGTYVAADEFGRPHFPETDVIQPDPFNAAKATAPAIQDMWQKAINPPLKLEATFPDVVTAHGACPGTVEPGVDPNGTRTNFDTDVPRPCAEAINISHSSMWVVNYRNEPVALRVYDPNKAGPDLDANGNPNMGAQADGPAGDLALAFQSRNDRKIPQFNTKFGDTPYPTGNAVVRGDTGQSYCSGNDGDGINCDRGAGDPFTPIMRAYEGDEVKVKIQVGATEEQHQTTVHGLKWLSNGSGFGRSPNSGWRNFQSHGISEQFSLQAPLTPALKQAGQTVDYLYAQDATRDGIWMGTWGILRTYGKQRSDLVVLGDNNKVNDNPTFSNASDFNGVCPKDAPVASYDVTAVLANEVLPNSLGVTIPQLGDEDPASELDPVTNTRQTYGQQTVGGALDPAGGTLVYNRRGTSVPTVDVVENGVTQTFRGGDGPLNDPTAMMYVLTDDLMGAAEAWAVETGAAGCFNPEGNTRGKPNPNAGKFNPTLASCVLPEGILDGCLTSGGGYNDKLSTCAVQLRPEAPVEPLVLRANAGDCIDVTLRNKLVNEQAYTMVGGVKKKVYYSDGSPVFADLGKNLDWYIENADGMLETVDRATANVVLDLPPDLAGWQDVMWIKTRRIQGAGVNAEMHFFNNNLIRPGSYVGLHPQLVTYDGSRDDGVAIGRNQPQLAAPGGTATMQFYAGEIEYVDDTGNCKGKNGNKHCLKVVATPIEFGGSNLLSADRVKQPQKGLFGALVIEPKGATVTEDTVIADGQGTGSATRSTRAQVTVTSPAGDAGSGGDYREALAMGHRITNLRWKDGSAIKNIHQGELGREGAEDSGHAGFNYGMEPSWFRFKLPPNVPFGNAQSPVGEAFGSIPNVEEFYANGLVDIEPNHIPAIPGVSAAGDPQTPVFRVTADPSNPVTDTRMYVLNGASADRDGTFVLHGHVWQRDPYVCTGMSQDASVPLTGRCDPNAVASQALGLNPQGKYMGGQEGMGHAYGHWPILFDAGGTGHVVGDYLFRDYTPSGNRNGQFGILRVE